MLAKQASLGESGSKLPQSKRLFDLGAERFEEVVGELAYQRSRDVASRFVERLLWSAHACLRFF